MGPGSGPVDGLRWCLHLTPPANPGENGKNRYTRQDYQQSIKGIGPVSAKGVVEKDGSHSNKHGGNERIADHAIGPESIRIAPAEDEHGAARDQVEEPFREDGEGKKLPEVSAQ